MPLAFIASMSSDLDISLKKFVPFRDPIVFKKGSMQYLWDAEDNKYIDLLGMNVCISVGHSHPTVVKAAQAQAAELTHCTTMFYHPVPAHLAEELVETLPKGPDWVVHFCNSGAIGATRRTDMSICRTMYSAVAAKKPSVAWNISSQ